MLIRQATLADTDLVTALTRAAYTPWIAVIHREPLPMIADYAKAIPHHRIDILDDPGPVALIEMIPRQDHLWIENLAVHPDHQSRGYGPHLLAHAATIARSLALPELRLLTNEAFTANLRFYRNRGFAQSNRVAIKDGHVVHFSKAV